jgi:hypothetical protein
MSSFIVLTAKGGIKVSTLDTTTGVEAGIAKAFKRAKGPLLVGSWTWQKMKFTLYGYKEGRAGTENKHELPLPFDTTVLFGDACVVGSLEKGGSTVVNLTADHWKRFYNSKTGAFEEEEEEEEEDEDDEDDEEELEDEIDEEEVDDDVAPGEVEEEEEVEDEMPVLKSKVVGVAFKKIPKWMHVAELVSDEYVL